MKSTGAWGAFRAFLKRKNVEFSATRTGSTPWVPWAQGLFASLLIGTIIGTLENSWDFRCWWKSGITPRQLPDRPWRRPSATL